LGGGGGGGGAWGGGRELREKREGVIPWERRSWALRNKGRGHSAETEQFLREGGWSQL